MAWHFARTIGGQVALASGSQQKRKFILTRIFGLHAPYSSSGGGLLSRTVPLGLFMTYFYFCIAFVKEGNVYGRNYEGGDKQTCFVLERF